MKTLLCAAILCTTGCTSEAERQRIEAERHRVIEEKKKQQEQEIEQKAKHLAAEMAKEQKQTEAKERAERKHQTLVNLQRSPAPFFEASGLEFFDKGIVNRYQQLSKLTLTNKSAFSIRDIRGQVEFLDDRNEAVASIPIRLEGLLPPRGTRTFSATEIAGNTVQTDATKARFVVTAVAVNEDN